MNDLADAFRTMNGVHIAKISGFSDDGMTLVELGGIIRHALAMVPLDEGSLGCDAAVVGITGRNDEFLILGLINPPKIKRKVVEADSELVLRCGKSSVTLCADGRVTIKGKQLLSRAEGQNRVQGASVLLN
ncbi:MAG: hypothetical protein AAF557_03110 [Pseudomonadota bacterium]